MPFEKTYDQRLRTFPPALRHSSIQYRELKQIIGRLVDELNDLGFSPETLRQVISSVAERSGEQKFSYAVRNAPEGNTTLPQQAVDYSKIHYEVSSELGKPVQPHLRVCTTTTPSAADHKTLKECGTCKVDELVPSAVRAITVDHPTSIGIDGPTPIPYAVAESAPPTEKTMREVIIPLVNDAEFFNLLEGNIQTLTTQMKKIHSEFLESLRDLAEMIADTCQPASVAANYKPYSGVSTHPGTVEVKFRRMKSDLYAWREIFAIFVESEVFEHTSNDRKVEWSIEESEKRVNSFADKVARRKGRDGPKETFKDMRSAEALQIFISLNFHILDIRKVFQANIEAIQKLVKKHTEHTGLPISCSFSDNAKSFSIGHLNQSFSIPSSGLVHPRFFIQKIAEKLFPIVPSQDDYSCAICINIAFKPIRLSCMHLFCARCLVKMQRSKEGNCPMCRAPSVLEANAKNVDWGLLNFMEDWFPREAREKLRADEREVVNEQLAEWRGNEAQCAIM